MLPLFSRQVIYPLQEIACRRPTFPCLRDLERSQWLTREELRALQRRRLNDLLKAAMEHSPWHARRIQAAGLADAIKLGSLKLQDLRLLPTMTKTDARAHIDELVWHQVPGGVKRYNTGGSSGEPLIFFFGKARQASDAAGRMRARRWWGVEPGQKEVYLWGAPVELNKTDRMRTIRDRLLNQLVLNAFAMGTREMDEYLETLQAWQPVCIYGYASSLALLAAHALASGKPLTLKRLKVVCTTGETLDPQQRALISKTFGAPVANEFGSRDIGFMAHEAPSGEILFQSESHIIEILDESGNAVPQGEFGEAVLTGLTSAAQPFIRYRTGDVVRMGNPSENQRRGLDVIREIAGRQTDFVVSSDGTIIHALAIIYVLRAVPGIFRFKCIQHSRKYFEVKIQPSPDWQDSSKHLIMAGLTSRLGGTVQIEIIVVDEISVESSGKHRHVISHVSLSDSLHYEPLSG